MVSTNPQFAVRKERTFITISRVATLEFLNPGMKEALMTKLNQDITAMIAPGNPQGPIQIEYRRCVDPATGQVCWCKWELFLNQATGEYEWQATVEECPP